MKEKVTSKHLYLRTIYRLSQDRSRIRNVDIARELGYSKPSVTNAITLALSTDHKGSAANCNAEFNWIIESIEYPDGYVPEDEGKIRELIKEGFICESYSELFNHERVKNVSVRFEC